MSWRQSRMPAKINFSDWWEPAYLVTIATELFEKSCFRKIILDRDWLYEFISEPLLGNDDCSGITFKQFVGKGIDNV